MRRVMIALFVVAGLVLAQNPETASFPGSIANPLVARNRPNAALTSDVTSTATSIPVTDGTQFRYPTVIAIDFEYIKICSISTNTLTVCSGGRGLYGTTGAAHTSGAIVSAPLTEGHINGLDAEVVGIESALGANLANVVQTGGSYSDPSWLTLSKSKVGLGNVENTALSTWAGSTSITTLGTISSGTVPWARLSNVPSYESPLTFSSPLSRSTNTISCPTCVLTSGSYSDPSWLSISKAEVGLGSVENTALSTWAGSANITMLGTITAGSIPWSLITGAPSGGGASVWTQSGTDVYYTGGKVGVGLASPLDANFVVSGTVNTLNDMALRVGYVEGNGYNTGVAALDGPRTMSVISRQGTYQQTMFFSDAAASTSTIFGISSSLDGGATWNPRLVVRQDGTVGIGTNAPGYALQLSTNSAAKPTSNTWTIASDARLKANIRPFTDGLALVEQLQPKVYELNGLAGLPAGITGISLIAQDVKDIAPYLIGTFKAKLNPTDPTDTDLYNLDSGPMVWVLTNAINDLVKQTIRPVFAADVEPACNESTRGQTRFIKDDLLGDQEKVCGRAANGTYSWKVTVQF